MTAGRDCACSTAPKLIFACSGAADVGEVADHGMTKGSTEVSEANVAKAAEAGAAKLAC
jgi:uncharacterized metal-binding protein